MDDQKKALMATVGKQIRHYRRMKFLSQEELALRASLNPAYFGQVERGLKCPTIDTLYRIAKAMEVPLIDLLHVSSTVQSTDVYSDRLKELLAQIPIDKQGQIVDILESIIKLY